jgi:hypothetical protein
MAVCACTGTETNTIATIVAANKDVLFKALSPNKLTTKIAQYLLYAAARFYMNFFFCKMIRGLS